MILSVGQVISVERSEWVPVFTGLSVRALGKLVLIVGGMLVPTHDSGKSASGKSNRYSVTRQVAVDAHTRLVVAVDEPTTANRRCRKGKKKTSTPSTSEYQ